MQFASVATCCVVCYLLPHATQYTICCHMLHGSLFAAAIATCRTICYLLLHAVQFATCCLMPYSCWFLLHTLQLLFVAVSYIVAICCCMLCGCYFVAACYVVWFLLLIAVQFALFCYMPCSYSLVFVAACCAVCYLLPYAMQLVICCCTLYSLSFTATPTAQHNLEEIGCSKNCLIISNTNNCNGLSDKVHCHKKQELQFILTISIMLQSQRPGCASNILECPIYPQISQYSYGHGCPRTNIIASMLTGKL